jgi:hypothetical protein
MRSPAQDAPRARRKVSGVPGIGVVAFATTSMPSEEAA